MNSSKPKSATATESTTLSTAGGFFTEDGNHDNHPTISAAKNQSECLPKDGFQGNHTTNSTTASEKENSIKDKCNRDKKYILNGAINVANDKAFDEMDHADADKGGDVCDGHLPVAKEAIYINDTDSSSDESTGSHVFDKVDVRAERSPIKLMQGAEKCVSKSCSHRFDKVDLRAEKSPTKLTQGIEKWISSGSHMLDKVDVRAEKIPTKPTQEAKKCVLLGSHGFDKGAEKCRSRAEESPKKLTQRAEKCHSMLMQKAEKGSSKLTTRAETNPSDLTQKIRESKRCLPERETIHHESESGPATKLKAWDKHDDSLAQKKSTTFSKREESLLKSKAANCEPQKDHGTKLKASHKHSDQILDTEDGRTDNCHAQKKSVPARKHGNQNRTVRTEKTSSSLTQKVLCKAELDSSCNTKLKSSERQDKEETDCYHEQKGSVYFENQTKVKDLGEQDVKVDNHHAQKKFVPFGKGKKRDVAVERSKLNIKASCSESPNRNLDVRSNSTNSSDRTHEPIISDGKLTEMCEKFDLDDNFNCMYQHDDFSDFWNRGQEDETQKMEIDSDGTPALPQDEDLQRLDNHNDPKETQDHHENVSDDDETDDMKIVDEPFCFTFKSYDPKPFKEMKSADAVPFEKVRKKATDRTSSFVQRTLESCVSSESTEIEKQTDKCRTAKTNKLRSKPKLQSSAISGKKRPACNNKDSEEDSSYGNSENKDNLGISSPKSKKAQNGPKEGSKRPCRANLLGGKQKQEYFDQEKDQRLEVTKGNKLASAVSASASGVDDSSCNSDRHTKGQRLKVTKENTTPFAVPSSSGFGESHSKGNKDRHTKGQRSICDKDAGQRLSNTKEVKSQRLSDTKENTKPSSSTVSSSLGEDVVDLCSDEEDDEEDDFQRNSSLIDVIGDKR